MLHYIFICGSLISLQSHNIRTRNIKYNKQRMMQSSKHLMTGKKNNKMIEQFLLYSKVIMC